MSATLVTAGVVCLIAAIVGGGLKAFAMDVPVLQSGRRQFLLATLGAVLLVTGVISNKDVASAPRQETGTTAPTTHATVTIPTTPERSSTSSTTTLTETTTTQSLPNLSGTWIDADSPETTSQVTQTGRSFRFTRWGVLNGIAFQSTGSGTITDPTSYESNYNARFQSGAVSTGECHGVISADTRSIVVTCGDSLLGTFAVTMLRK